MANKTKMRLNKKEKEILTFFEHGASDKNLISVMSKFFDYSEKEIKKILEKLKKKRLIEEIKIPEIDKNILITSVKVSEKDMDRKVRDRLEIKMPKKRL